MAVTEDEVKHVARLARLEVGDPRVGCRALVDVAGHFNLILAHFERLQEVDTSGVVDAVDAVDVTPWRNDEVASWDGREGALAQAPDRDEDYFRVPQILEEA